MFALMLEFQSVHEPTGPSEGYMQLEELVKQVVSPYLGLCEDHSFPGSTCALGKTHCAEVVAAVAQTPPLVNAM